MTRSGVAVAVTLVLLALAASAAAQAVDPSVARSLRVEWERIPDRPGVEGYVYNDSAYRIGLVRLSIVGRDEPSQPPTSTLAWVYGNVPARGRWPFRARVPASREILSISVESFSVIARDPTAESP